jgi:hypothetical protein
MREERSDYFLFSSVRKYFKIIIFGSTDYYYFLAVLRFEHSVMLDRLARQARQVLYHLSHPTALKIVMGRGD